MDEGKIRHIKTYSAESFREKYMKPEQKLDALLKPDFATFFIVRVEELIRLIKLPVPPMRTTNHTVIYLTEGEAIMTIGSETYRIEQGECLFVPAGQVFAFENVDINRGYLCNFHADFISGKLGHKELLQDFEFLTVWGNPRVQPDPQTATYVDQLLKRIFRAYTDHGLKHTDIIQSYFVAFLCEIQQAYVPLSDSPQRQSVRLTNAFKEQLFRHIKARHRVTDYASLLNITPNHLNKVVRQITGKSPSRWIDETLMMEAKVLLYQTELSVGEVAAELGIYDASYFSRLFKKHAGLTPLQFRKMIEKS